MKINILTNICYVLSHIHATIRVHTSLDMYNDAFEDIQTK